MTALRLLDNIVPISDFSHGKSSAAFSRVEDDNPVVVLRHNVPAYVIVTPDEYRKAKESEEDLELLSLALERTSRTNLDDCLSMEDLMAKYGITQAELDEMDEVEFE